MIIYEDNIINCSYAFHMIFSFCKYYRISEFICDCELCSIQFFLKLIHRYSFDLQLFYSLSIFLHGNFSSICDHMEGFFCKAFHKLEWDLHISVWKIRHRLTFKLYKIHMGMFSVIMVSFSKDHNFLYDSYFDMYDIRNSIFCRRHLRMSKKFRYNLQRPHFFHNNKSLNAFFYMVNSLHDDSFFHICVYYNSELFRTFYHIGIFVALSCILLFLYFFHISTKWGFLRVSKVCIFLYDKVEDKDGDNKVLFFYHRFVHMNEVQYLFHILDLWTFHNSNNIWAWFHCNKTCIEGSSK